jgi:hypothetical protein
LTVIAFSAGAGTTKAVAVGGTTRLDKNIQVTAHTIATFFRSRLKLILILSILLLLSVGKSHLVGGFGQVKP